MTTTEKPITYTAAIRALAEKHGQITPELVLDAAKPKTSPLHAYFLWDNTAAARKYREIQAQQLIRSIKVTYEPRENVSVRIREFVCITPDSGDPETAASNIYIPYQAAVKVDTYKDQVLAQCRRDAESFRQKYRALQEAAEIITAMESTILTEATEANA